MSAPAASGVPPTGSPPEGEAVVPFTLDVAQSALDDLHDRLDRTRWPAAAPEPGWGYGVPLDYLRELARYWRHDYDWRKQARALNAHPQYVTNIDGQRVHFLHARSPRQDALPLLLVHGWPGSVAEFLDVIGPLTDPEAYGGKAADAFHLIVPSLPGYGLSGPVTEPGWDVRRIASAFVALIHRLGYERYGAQGGDWGSAICREVGIQDASHVAGVHLNLLLTPPDRGGRPADELDADERRHAEKLHRYRTELSGYFALQSSRPQTLAYALTDSPVGQLAWIVERFMDWTDSHTAPEDAVDRDRLLTDVMLYWLTATAGSSAGLYREEARSPHRPRASATPTAVAVFPHDLSHPVRSVAEKSDTIVRWTQFDRGGHFAAMEAPDLLVDDIRAFFRTLR